MLFDRPIIPGIDPLKPRPKLGNSRSIQRSVSPEFIIKPVQFVPPRRGASLVKHDVNAHSGEQNNFIGRTRTGGRRRSAIVHGRDVTTASAAMAASGSERLPGTPACDEPPVVFRSVDADARLVDDTNGNGVARLEDVQLFEFLESFE